MIDLQELRDGLGKLDMIHVGPFTKEVLEDLIDRAERAEVALEEAMYDIRSLRTCSMAFAASATAAREDQARLDRVEDEGRVEKRDGAWIIGDSPRPHGMDLRMALDVQTA